MNTINELTEELRLRDLEIERLNKANRELNERLNVYNSVLSRSRVKKSMHMSMLLGQNKLTESIIETKQEYLHPDALKPFEQFFIVDLAQQASDSPHKSKYQEAPLRFSYLFDPQNPMQELIGSFLQGNQGSEW